MTKAEFQQLPDSPHLCWFDDSHTEPLKILEQFGEHSMRCACVECGRVSLHTNRGYFPNGDVHRDGFLHEHFPEAFGTVIENGEAVIVWGEDIINGNS